VTRRGSAPEHFSQAAQKIFGPIRISVWDPLGMTKHTKGLRAVLREVTQSSERSTLFWWMVEHHRELKASSGGRRLRWEKLSAVFNELGLTDINGNPAKPNTARQTWLRARRFVAEEERRLAATRRPWATYPSRMPKDFRPAAIQNGNGLPEHSVPGYGGGGGSDLTLEKWVLKEADSGNF
jgi:hypothetical protein